MKLALTIFLLGPALTPAWADFTYQETTRITGGAMAGMMNMAGAFSKSASKAMDPKQSTISIKGNRMARRSTDTLIVTDLDNETITSVNYAKKSYSVMTFAQMKQAMSDMQSRMKSSKQSSAPASQDSSMEFDVKVNDTGNTKSIGGNNTHEVIMTITMKGTDAQSGAKGGMSITSDMWLVPNVPGYGEVREFYKRMSQKMAWMPEGNPMLMSRPGMSEAVARMSQEAAKMNGIPILKVTRMDGVVEGMPPSDPSAAPPQQQTQNSAPPTSIGGALGGMLAQRMAKRRQADSSAAPAGSDSGSGSLMEMTQETNGFSQTADASIFEIPSGFAKVDDPMTRAGRGSR